MRHSIILNLLENIWILSLYGIYVAVYINRRFNHIALHNINHAWNSFYTNE